MSKRKPTANLDAAWDAFFATQKIDDPAAIRAAGWRLPDDVARKLGTNPNTARQTCMRAVEARTFESKKFRVPTGQGVRDVTFYRPLTK